MQGLNGLKHNAMVLHILSILTCTMSVAFLICHKGGACEHPSAT